MLRLIIGNKNYSSWSMRPWVLLRQAGIPFEEVKLRFDSYAPDSAFKRALQGWSPTGKVPVLLDQSAPGRPLIVWDSLAIVEYVAECFADRLLWPADPHKRAVARSVCAEMHGGFAALRRACPMNVEAHLPDTGALIWRDNAAVRADVARLTVMWEGLLAQHGGPLLFGDFSVPDAYYAPVCLRLRTYALPMSATVADYVERVLTLPSVQEWVRDALAERDFLPAEEPYRLHP